jgi:2,4-diaminopentanoate dehydrogenase
LISTLHVGLGTIGQQVLQATVRGGKGCPVAGVDPVHAGKSLAEVAGLEGLTGRVYASLGEALELRPAVAVLSTASSVEAVMPDLRQIIAGGGNVVSTCERLSYPWLSAPGLAEEINDLAHEAAVSVVGTGINPGFLLDALPVLLARPVVDPRHLRATRIVNTARRRPQLQDKTGAGLTVAEFQERAERGHVGHVGLAESAALVARGLGWEVVAGAIAEHLEPVIAETSVSSDHVTVPPGLVLGQLQSVKLAGPDGRTLTLTLRMALGEPEEYDEVIIEGDPPLHARILGGVFGDTATAGCTANILPQVVAARAGLLTVLDLPLV